MRRVTIVLAVLAACPLLADVPTTPAPTTGDSRVTLALSEYETLRDANERPSATVIDTVRLAGSFAARDLSITFSGSSIGRRPQAPVVDSTNDVTIAGCSGAAILTRTAKGAFAVIPTAETFDLKCNLRISGSDRLQMHVTPNVLSVQSAVSDGELIAADEDANGGRDYSLVREVSGSGERLAATATGRYRITLLPDATRFQYTIDVHNPNRSTSTLALTLVSNEHLQQIDSAAPYEVEGNRYVFTIPPGDSAIAMTGELRGAAFRAPVDASLQYLVIESHPLIRPAVQTPAKRVSIAETGITPQYRGALAFESGTQQIAWQVTRLEALRAISYAANSATHRFFVPLDGPVLGESEFQVRNEGAAELVLPPRPEPTFVSLGDEPILMTKNRAGQLTVPLSSGVQNVLEQHRQPFTRHLGIGFGRIVVPQLDVAASQTNVTMTYPAEWIPLYESFATRGQYWTPDFAMVLLFAALAIWVERLLAWLGMTLVRRTILAAAAGLAGTAVFSFLVVLIIACGIVTVAWLSTRSQRDRLVAAGGIVLCGLIVLVAVTSSNVSLRKFEGSEGVAGIAGSEATRETATVVTDTIAPGRLPQSAPPETQVYQGLPAKFDLPNGSRSSGFSQELLRVDREQSVRVIAVSMVVVKWIGLLVALAVIAILVRDRRRLIETFRAKTVAPLPAPAPAT